MPFLLFWLVMNLVLLGMNAYVYAQTTGGPKALWGLAAILNGIGIALAVVGLTVRPF